MAVDPKVPARLRFFAFAYSSNESLLEVDDLFSRLFMIKVARTTLLAIRIYPMILVSAQFYLELSMFAETKIIGYVLMASSCSGNFYHK
jgi:hypothetical protein